MLKCQLPKRKVFISYSHVDKEYLHELQKNLAPLKSQGLLEAWDDTQIQQGQLWREEIDKALNETKVAILLISENFLASDFIRNHELPYFLAAAKKKGVTVIPVKLRDCAWKSVCGLGELQAFGEDVPLARLRKGDRRQQEWYKISSFIVNLVENNPTKPLWISLLSCWWFANILGATLGFAVAGFLKLWKPEPDYLHYFTGFFAGAFIGIFQWIIIRQYILKSLSWMLLCILSWAFIFPLVNDNFNWLNGLYLGGAVGFLQALFFWRRHFSHIFVKFFLVPIYWTIANLVGYGAGFWCVNKTMNYLNNLKFDNQRTFAFNWPYEAFGLVFGTGMGLITSIFLVFLMGMAIKRTTKF